MKPGSRGVFLSLPGPCVPERAARTGEALARPVATISFSLSVISARLLNDRHGIRAADFAYALDKLPIGPDGARCVERRLGAVVFHQFKRNTATARAA